MSSTIKNRPLTQEQSFLYTARSPLITVYNELWRAYLWLDGSLPLSLMEGWEKLLLLLVVLLLSSLVLWSMLFHLPDHMRTVSAKSAFYVFGTPATRSSNMASASNTMLSVGSRVTVDVHAAGQSARSWIPEL